MANLFKGTVQSLRTNNEYANVILNISGKGELSFIISQANFSASVTISVDGGTRMKIDLAARVQVDLKIPFNTSVKVTSDQSLVNCGYLLF